MKRLHRNCVTDPLTRAWWLDYQRVVRQGNAYGLSFTEYVANRTLAEANLSHAGPTYTAGCGHTHPWGASCATWTST